MHKENLQSIELKVVDVSCFYSAMIEFVDQKHVVCELQAWDSTCSRTHKQIW